MKKTFLFLTMLLCMGIVGTRAQVTALYENFENGIPAGWTILDVDNDGATWTHSSVSDPCYGGHNSSDGYLFSYDNPTVDNWLITPAITLGTDATLTFWRCTQFLQYAEHYGVYVSTTTPEPSAFTLVYEETGVQGQYGWRERTVDISAYDGNTVYIAFRHFNSNVNLLAIDDITLTMNTSVPTIETTPTELDFGTVAMGTPSPSQEVNVTTFNITGAVTASVSGSFEISLDDTVFSSSVTMPNTGGTLYVRYFPMYVGTDSEVLVLTNSSVTLSINLSGESVDCSNITLPFYEDFDSYPEYTIPTCWHKINPYQGYPMISTSYVYSGKTMMFKCNPSTGEPTYLVMPEMPQALSNLQISFWTRRGSTSAGPFSVGYMTDPADGSTFVPLWTKTGDEIPNYSYYPFVVDFSNVNTDPSLSYYIAFKYQTTSSASWHVDNVMVEEISGCNAPTDLTVNAVSSNSANISWSGYADSYVVFYKRSSDTAWTEIQDVILDTNGFTLNNLVPASNYTWYVAADCEDGTLLSSLSTSTFQTSCATLVAPFSENFNAQNAIPNCWERMTGYASDAFAGTNPTVTSSGWSMTTTGFGNYHPKLNIWGTAVKGWLVTPPIDLSDLANPALTFDIALTKYNSADPILNPTAQADDKFMVIISTDNGATWSAANATIWSDSASVGDYPYSQIATTGEEVVISLAAYANQTVRIAFYGESKTSGGDNDLHIDNLYVGEAASCPKPTGVTVDSLSHNFAEISWNNTQGSTSWEVEYKAVSDTGWTTITVSDTMVGLTGLTQNTSYMVQVMSVCSEGEFSQPTTVTFTTHMAAQSIPYSTDFAATSDRNWVLNNGNRPNYWTIGDLGDESALFVTNNGTDAAYTVNGAFSIVSAEKLFTIGEASQIQISFDVKVGGEGTFDYLKAFFDLADASYPASNTFQSYADYDYGMNSINFPISVSAYPYMINLTGGNTVHVEAVVPNPNSNPTENSTGKLVFLWKNDQSDGTQPSAIIYNVSVDAVSCTAPTDLTVSNITTTSAEISWTPSGTENEWVLGYRAEGDPTWSDIQVSGVSFYPISGLMAGTSYQIRVQSVCGADEASLWLAGAFSTPCETITTFPYTEDFENGGLRPDCWTQEYVTGMIDWTYQAGGNSTSGITTAHSGSYNAYFYQASNSGFTTKLISPIFDLSNVSSPTLTYWYSQAAWVSDQDILAVYYRTSPSAQWQTLSMHTTSVTSWTMDSLLLPNPTATYQIAFEGIALYGYGITLDDITINGTIDTTVIPEPCEAPTELQQLIALKELGGIHVTWLDLAGVSEWNLQYRPLNGQWTTVVVTGQPEYHISGLVNGDVYEIRVQAVCGPDNLSEWSAILTATATNSGIEDFLTNSVTLYPNPANDVINVQWTMDNVQLVEVIDVYGKLINTVSTAAALQQPYRINVSGLASGVYFVRVTMGEGVVTKSFVKK